MNAIRSDNNPLTLNDDIFRSLLEYLKCDDRDKVAQPHLVVGASGSGKTTLLRRLQTEIGKGIAKLRPIFIEGRALFSPEDLLKRFDAVAQDSRRTVLLIDNIQYYFKRTTNRDHYRLRGELNKAGAPIIIATSNEVLHAFTDYEAAFFEGFMIRYIRPLERKWLKALAGPGIDMERLAGLMRYLPATPRSLRLAVSIMEESTDRDMDTSLLVDRLSPLCQERYDGYTTQVQRILSAIASFGNGVNLRQIREMTGQENSKITPYLKLMVDQWIIERVSETRRKGIYTIADPLLKLWLQRNAMDMEGVPAPRP